MYAAVQAVRKLRPHKVIVAVPTSSADALHRLSRIADEAVALSTPEPYIAVGAWYQYFDQLSDSDVVDLLADAGQEAADVT